MSITGPPVGSPEASERVRLARAALGAALSDPGVVRGDTGALGVIRTRDGAGALAGVTVAAEAGGRYSVDLHLVTRLVPLRPLADGVIERVHRAASRAGLSAVLGTVSVSIDDVEVAGP